MLRNAGVFLVAAAFAFAASGIGCKGKDDKKPSNKAEPAPKKPVTPKPTTDKPPVKDGAKTPAPPPVPAGFDGKMSAFYKTMVKSLKEQADCAKLGADLQAQLKGNNAMFNAYVGTPDGAKWRENNKALQREFQQAVSAAIPKCMRDKTFQGWMRQIQTLAAKWRAGAKDDAAGAPTPGGGKPPGKPAPDKPAPSKP